MKGILKIWVDDIRPAPEGYIWLKSVNEVKKYLADPHILCNYEISLIDLDHDAGDYAKDGGDYIRILDWLEEIGYDGYIHIHSMNAIGKMNMEAICHRNGWTIVE